MFARAEAPSRVGTAMVVHIRAERCSRMDPPIGGTGECATVLFSHRGSGFGIGRLGPHPGTDAAIGPASTSSHHQHRFAGPGLSHDLCLLGSIEILTHTRPVWPRPVRVVVQRRLDCQPNAIETAPRTAILRRRRSQVRSKSVHPCKPSTLSDHVRFRLDGCHGQCERPALESQSRCVCGVICRAASAASSPPSCALPFLSSIHRVWQRTIPSGKVTAIRSFGDSA